MRNRNKKDSFVVIRRLFAGFGLLLFCQAVYLLAAVLLMEPVIHSGMDWAIRQSGLSYLTSENLFYFIRQPAALLVITAILVLGSLLILFGMILTMSFYMQGEEKKKRTPGTVFSAFAGRVLRLPIADCPGLMLVSAGEALFFVFPVLFWVAGRIRLTSYLIAFLNKQPFLKSALPLCAAALCIAAFLFLFFLPYGVLERKKLTEALSRGRELQKGGRLWSALFFLLWNLIFTGGLALLYLLLMSGSALLVKALVDKTVAVAVFLLVYERLNRLLLFGTLFLAVLLNTGLMTCMYIVRKEKKGEAFDKMPAAPPVFSKKKTHTRRILAGGCLIVLMLEILYACDLIRNGSGPDGGLGYIAITSHRGYSAKAPENTLPALEEAVSALADAAEIDVRLTRDKVAVLFHDATLYRLAGSREAVRDLDYEELKKRDVGSWFNPAYQETSIPALEEVLAFAKGKLNLNIELKGSKDNSELVREVVRLIEAFDFEKQCVITSMVYRDLEEVKEWNGALKTGYILSGGYRDFYGKSQAADFFSIKSEFMTEGLVRSIHSLGKEVHVWTVNSRREMERMKQIGVDTLITDRPILAREVLYREETGKSLIDLLNLVY